MIKISNNDISNITYGNNKIEKVYLGESFIWPSKYLTPRLTPEFEVVDGIENASGNFEDVYDTSLNAWFKKAKQYDPSQDKIVTTSKYILYGDGFGGKEVWSFKNDYETLYKTAYFFIQADTKHTNLDFVEITDNKSYIELKTSDYRAATPDYRAYLELNNLRDFVPLYNQEISFKVDSLDDNYVFFLNVVGKIKIISNPFDPSTNGTFVSDNRIIIRPTTTYQTLVFQDLCLDDEDFNRPRRINFSWTTPNTPIKKGYIKIKQNVYYPYYFEGLPVKTWSNKYIFENNEFKVITEPEVQLTEDFPHNIPITKTIKTEWLEEGKDWQTDGGKAKDGFVYHTSNPYPPYVDDLDPEKYIGFNLTDDYGNLSTEIWNTAKWQAALKYADSDAYDGKTDSWISSMPKGTSYTYTVYNTGPYMYFGGVTDASSAQRLHFMSAYLYDMRQILPKKDKPHNNVKYSSVDELELNEVPYVGMVAYIGSGSDYEKYQFVCENSEYKWKDTGETWKDTGEEVSQ